MNEYGLPTYVVVDGVRYDIRSDYRAVLDILTALSDGELADHEKINIMLRIFYRGTIPDNVESAIKECLQFINRGQLEDAHGEQQPKLMDWDQDFQYIADAISIKRGSDIRGVEQLHWWTFLGYYMNIGDCYFAQIVSIRKKKSKNEKLDKSDIEFYRLNKQAIDFPQNEAERVAEQAALAQWMGGG